MKVAGCRAALYSALYAMLIATRLL